MFSKSIRFRHRNACAAAISLLAALSVSPDSHAQRFDNPQVDGMPMDQCLGFAVDCGQPAADYFCDMNGYPSASDWGIENSPSDTKTLKTKEICDTSQWICDKFSFIECDTPLLSGKVSIPAPLDASKIVVTNGYDDITPSENGQFQIRSINSIFAFDYQGNLIYESIPSSLVDVELNAKETAIAISLRLLPMSIYSGHEKLTILKDFLNALISVRNLENAIENTVQTYGYLLIDNITDEVASVQRVLFTAIQGKQDSTTNIFRNTIKHVMANNLTSITQRSDEVSRTSASIIPDYFNNGFKVRIDDFRNIEGNYFELDLTVSSQAAEFAIMKVGNKRGLAFDPASDKFYLIEPVSIMEGIKDSLVDPDNILAYLNGDWSEPPFQVFGSLWQIVRGEDSRKVEWNSKQTKIEGLRLSCDQLDIEIAGTDSPKARLATFVNYAISTLGFFTRSQTQALVVEIVQHYEEYFADYVNDINSGNYNKIGKDLLMATANLLLDKTFTKNIPGFIANYKADKFPEWGLEQVKYLSDIAGRSQLYIQAAESLIVGLDAMLSRKPAYFKIMPLDICDEKDEPMNIPPIANDDSIGSKENSSVTINVIANDTDSDGTIDPTSISIVSQPINGLLTINNNGTVVYTPNTGFTGTDSFMYNVKDDKGAVSNEATVTISVGADTSSSFSGNWVFQGTGNYGWCDVDNPGQSRNYQFETTWHMTLEQEGDNIQGIHTTSGEIIGVCKRQKDIADSVTGRVLEDNSVELTYVVTEDAPGCKVTGTDGCSVWIGDELKGESLTQTFAITSDGNLSPKEPWCVAYGPNQECVIELDSYKR
jgi:hypothetical protein